jgi:hypothetical protein
MTGPRQFQPQRREDRDSSRLAISDHARLAVGVGWRLMTFSMNRASARAMRRSLSEHRLRQEADEMQG